MTSRSPIDSLDVAVIDDVYAPRLAKIGAWIVVPLCALLTGIHLVASPPEHLRAAGTGLMALVGLVAMVLLERERHRAGFLTMTVGTWVATWLIVAATGGLYSHNVAIFPMVIMIAGLFLGTRASMGIAALTVAVGLIFAVAHVIDILPVPHDRTLPFPIVTLIAVTAMSALGTWFFSHAIAERMVGLQRETANREYAESIALDRQRQLTEIANNVPGVVYQFACRADGSHGYSFVGSRSMEVFGIENDPDAFEAHLLSAIHPDDLPGFALAGEQAISNPAPWQFEGRFRKPSDAAAGEDWRWFRAECRPTRRHGETVFSGVLSDVTTRREAEIQIQDMTRQLASVNAELEKRVTERTRELEATANRLQQIIDTIDSALLVWSGNRTLILWNQAFLRIFPATAPLLRIGLEREALAGIMRAAGEMIPVDHPAAQWDALGSHEVALPNGRIIEINRLRTADDGRLIMHTDVTELRRNRQIIARNERLAALGSLVAGVAHEINTPLGNALMVSTTLADHLREFDHARDDGPLTRSAFDQFVARVHESNDHLLRNLRRAADLILHFKQVAVDQTSDRRRRFELATVLEDVRATVSNRVRKAGHAIEVNCPSGIAMDSYPGALGQIATNLVENAIIHAFGHGQNGLIAITVRSLPGNEVEIVFSDDGNGIPPRDIGRVFDPFFTTRLGSGGSGLGLSIVLNLVRDALGGDIGVESAPAQGTSFVIRIPANAPVRKAQAAERP